MDETLTESDAGRYVEQVSPDSRPSHLIGFVAFWFTDVAARRADGTA